jgi:hypothetical protein
MKMKILFGIVIAVLASSLAGFAQENTAKSGEESKLAFVVEPVKTIYAKGEKVEFTFRLSNHSRDKVLVAKTFQLAHFVTLDVVNAEGKHVEWCGRIAGQTDLPQSFIALPPGESVSKKLIVSCVNKDDRSRAWGYSLEAPGKYVVTGTYRLPQPEAFFKKLSPNVPAMRGPVSAQPVTVEIR